VTNSIEKKVKDLFRLQGEIKALDDQLSRMKAKLHLMVTTDLPEAMAEFGSSKWENDRFICKIDFKLYGSLPSDEDQRAAAIDYLFELGQEGIISADLTASFGRGDVATAKKFRYVMRDRMKEIERDDPVSLKVNVHPMTLQALGRNLIKENKPLKMEVLGLRGMTMANVKEK
jgi:hypothetical protein